LDLFQSKGKESAFKCVVKIKVNVYSEKIQLKKKLNKIEYTLVDAKQLKITKKIKKLKSNQLKRKLYIPVGSILFQLKRINNYYL
jgi:hypothetical protein